MFDSDGDNPGRHGRDAQKGYGMIYHNACMDGQLQAERVICEFMLSFSLFFPQGFCNTRCNEKGVLLGLRRR